MLQLVTYSFQHLATLSISGTSRSELNNGVPQFVNGHNCAHLTIKLLGRFAYCGRLVGHNGAVCALSSSDGTMVTGSRDRLIKVGKINTCTRFFYYHTLYLYSSMTLAVSLWTPLLQFHR